MSILSDCPADVLDPTLCCPARNGNFHLHDRNYFAVATNLELNKNKRAAGNNIVLAALQGAVRGFK